MRRLLLALLLALTTFSFAQNPAQKKEIYFTAVHADGSAVDQLSSADLKVPDAVQITGLEKVSDSPIRVGLLLDNSGSRRRIFPAQMELANLLIEKALREGKDPAFVVNFNEEPFIDQSLTTDAQALRKAVAKGSPRGASAIYDAIAVSSDYVKRDTQYPHAPAVLVFVTDGEDNASNGSESSALAKLQSAGVRVYAFHLGGDGPSEQIDRGKKILDRIAKLSGGRVFEVKEKKEIFINDQLLTLQNDMRNWFRAMVNIAENDGDRAFRIESRTRSVVITSPLIATRTR